MKHRYDIDGVIFFANDRAGGMVPRELIESFAERFFAVDETGDVAPVYFSAIP